MEKRYFRELSIKLTIKKDEFVKYLKTQKRKDVTLHFWRQKTCPFQNIQNEYVNPILIVLRTGEWMFLPAHTSALQREKMLGVKLTMVHKWAFLPVLGDNDNPATSMRGRNARDQLKNRVRNLDGHTEINE